MIVLTSNLGSEYLANLPEGQPVEAARAQIMEAVRAAFRPEFLNRLDEILLFRRLSRDDMVGIVAIQLGQLQKLARRAQDRARNRRRGGRNGWPRQATTRSTAPGHCGG